MKSTQFIPATDRLLLRRLPPPPEGAIIKPQIAIEQSEYGWVVAIGEGVDVPVGPVAKFSRFSAEDIAFDDSDANTEFVLSYKQDIRGWFRPEPAMNVTALSEEQAAAIAGAHSGDFNA